MGILIIFSGLPAVGKTAIAKELAARLCAVYLRIDSIEQAIRNCGGGEDLADTGYRIAYAVAEDNLRLGHTVIADSVNPIQLTRDAWIGVAERAGVQSAEVEIACTDPLVHRRRVETRYTDIEGMRLPIWEDVVRREYADWDRERILIDTAGKTTPECAEELQDALNRAKK